MQQLIFFIQKYKFLLYFLMLQCIAIGLTIQNHSYHRSKIVSSSNAFVGFFQNQKNDISTYLRLKENNKDLVKENTELRNRLSKLNALLAATTIDSSFKAPYAFVAGKIIKNDYQKEHNFLTINLGNINGISKEMGVINAKGIIGITENLSNRFARVQSILNTNTKINAKFKNNNFFGTLRWNTTNPNIVQLTDLPREATFQIGDSIETGGKSTIFPVGIPIGTVLSIPQKLTASNTIDIKLFNDMTNLNTIYVIKNFDKEEIKSLEDNE